MLIFSELLGGRSACWHDYAFVQDANLHGESRKRRSGACADRRDAGWTVVGAGSVELDDEELLWRYVFSVQPLLCSFFSQTSDGLALNISARAQIFTGSHRDEGITSNFENRTLSTRGSQLEVLTCSLPIPGF
jgi:hypothetical protein